MGTRNVAVGVSSVFPLSGWTAILVPTHADDEAIVMDWAPGGQYRGLSTPAKSAPPVEMTRRGVFGYSPRTAASQTLRR